MCALLEYYAAYCGNSLPTFRDNLPVPFSKVKKSVRRVMSQKIAGLIYFASDARNHAHLSLFRSRLQRYMQRKNKQNT